MVKEVTAVIESELVAWLEGVGAELPEVKLEPTALPDFGEFTSNAALRYAKDLKQNPVQLATTLAEDMTHKRLPGVAKVEAVKPGFVNFFLTSEAKQAHALGINQLGDRFGNCDHHEGENWVIEHSSPNPNKAMHVGHLRNNLVGMSLVRLLQSAGAKVTADGVYNNRGIAIAKNMYGYLAHMKKNPLAPTDIQYWATHQDEWLLPADKGMRPDLFVTECYVQGENDFKTDPAVENVTRQMVLDWEAGDEVTCKLWSLVLQFAYDGIDMTLNRLGSHWDNVWYEHEHYEKGKDYVTKGVDQGVFSQLEDGAILTNLESEYGLSETVLLKKDGTALYITQDIALTDLKKKQYQADKLVWVVGPDQTLHMRQLFAVCEQLGIGTVEDFTHISYGYVGLKDASGTFKKMSSRAGTAILADDVIDQVRQTIKERFDEEARHETRDRDELAEKLALCAVKFAFLKSDSKLDLSFDITESVDVQGDSGMYVMYTYVRTQSILGRVTSFRDEDVILPNELGASGDLLRTLLYYEFAVADSVRDLSVHHISQYLLELSHQFNSWYAKETILDGGSHEPFKIALVQAVGVTITNGFNLLGIETVSEM